MLSCSMKSQDLTLDSTQVKKVLFAFNELKQLEALDSISSHQIILLNESITQYEISLRTCGIQSDTHEKLNSALSEVIVKYAIELRKAKKEVKLFKAASFVIIPVAFILGLIAR